MNLLRISGDTNHTDHPVLMEQRKIHTRSGSQHPVLLGDLNDLPFVFYDIEGSLMEGSHPLRIPAGDNEAARLADGRNHGPDGLY